MTFGIPRSRARWRAINAPPAAGACVRHTGPHRSSGFARLTYLHDARTPSEPDRPRRRQPSRRSVAYDVVVEGCGPESSDAEPCSESPPPDALASGGEPPEAGGGDVHEAIVQRCYGVPGDVLRLADAVLPEVGEEDVLVRVRASSANPCDWHFIRGEPVLLRPAGIGGVRRPKVPDPGRGPGRDRGTGGQWRDGLRTGG